MMTVEEILEKSVEARKKGRVLVMSEVGLMEHSLESFLRQTADGVLYDLNRDEATTLVLCNGKGGLSKLRLVNDYAAAQVIRHLLKPHDWRNMGPEELERYWERRRDELIAIRKELDRKKGEVLERKEVNFEEYVTE